MNCPIAKSVYFTAPSRPVPEGMSMRPGGVREGAVIRNGHDVREEPLARGVALVELGDRKSEQILVGHPQMFSKLISPGLSTVLSLTV
jgi:hypothetical protein